MNVPALLRMVAEAGFAVDVTDAGPTLVKTRDDASITGRLVESLKQHRGEVVLYLSRCVVCGKDVSCLEDRDRQRDPAHCEQGGGKAVTDGNGVYHPESLRCPFKSNH